jgi:hypothetical protein
MERMRLAQPSLTPNKSIVQTKVRGRSVEQWIRFIGKKGGFNYSPTCEECSFHGKVNDALGYHISPTCDRDLVELGTWRGYSRIYDVPKPCKFFKEKSKGDGENE